MWISLNHNNLRSLNFQERTYSFHCSQDVDEEGDEALQSIEEKSNDEFEFEEFWFDDVLSGAAELPEHLKLQSSKDYEEVCEPFTPQTHYILECENGKA